MIAQIVFVVMALITLVGAAGVVSARRPFLSALWLVLALFGVAGLYILLDAGLLAMFQVLIYVGAIGVLILFTIMLTRLVMAPVSQTNRIRYLALAAAMGLFGLLAASALRGPWQPSGGVVLPAAGGLIAVEATASGAQALPTTASPGAEQRTDEAGRPVIHVPGPVTMLGVALLTRHLLAFELVSAILLVALLGAVIIARE